METTFIFQNPLALYLLPLVWLIFLVMTWRRRFKPFGPFLLRLTMLVLLMLALSQPATVPMEITPEEKTTSERAIILVDQSVSIGEMGHVALRREAERLATYYDEAFLFLFADRAILIDGPNISITSDEADKLNQELTDLSQALLSGAEFINPTSANRLILLSDGQSSNLYNLPATLSKLPVPVDVLIPTAEQRQQWQGNRNEVQVSKVSVPPILRENEDIDVEILIQANTPTEVTLQLTHNNQVLAEHIEQITTSNNRLLFPTSVAEIGSQVFNVTIAPNDEADTWSQNNQLAAFAQVYPPSHILIVGPETEQVAQFHQRLSEAGGFIIDRATPDQIPTNLSALEPYSSMILLDVSARDMLLEQMVAIQEFVRSLGRGLLVTGGRHSLTLGGYAETPLADLLPVKLEAPPREERPPVALLLIIDHSGSMDEKESNIGLISKLAMAKEAAIRATDILGPEDLIGILMFDNGHQWVVPFRNVSKGAVLLDIQESIASIERGGGTRILEALQIGVGALIQQPAPQGAKHAVLLTDGRSFDGVDAEQGYLDILKQIEAENITLSTIAIGTGADQALMSYLAENGRGRYHFAERPDELPALTMAESDILRSNSLQEGDFQASVYAPHPMLRDLFVGTTVEQRDIVPPLLGYLALTPKATAETALQAGPGDPLLTVWGYGLGRVAVWSSDTGAEWAAGWLEGKFATRFWGQVIGYTLPAPDLGLLQLSVEIEADNAVTLIANAVSPTGQTIDLARTEAVLTTPNGQNLRPVTLHQVSPGQYQQSVRLADYGVYKLKVNQTRPADARNEAWQASTELGFVLSYPAEYNLPDYQTDEGVLQTVATETGGQIFTLGQVPTGVSLLKPDADEAAKPVEPIEYWPYLMVVALLLWPFEIAWRRWARLRFQ
ncbi:VWA domain-containing protein [Anaerolineales bacterium HSG24]|nr:VWA domain-containing protein [Anaerolineales bacterium HSG24]